jgi:hypothetical protein
MSGVITFTFRANYIPPHLLGRVTAATGFVVAGTAPLGAATAGALATAFGIRAALWALAALFAVMPNFLLATSLRTMRDFPDRPDYLSDSTDELTMDTLPQAASASQCSGRP